MQPLQPTATRRGREAGGETVKNTAETATRSLLGSGGGRMSHTTTYGSTGVAHKKLNPDDDEAGEVYRRARGSGWRSFSAGYASLSSLDRPESRMANSSPRQDGGEGAERPLNYRRLTSRSVTLPKEKWYKRIRIPGVTHRASPYSNVVHTTKYTILTFLPKNLWEQFHRFANIYFFMIIILNFIPAIEAVAKEVAWIPLTAILLVTAVKDLFEDYRRYRSDKEVNRRRCRVYDWDMGTYVEKAWDKVRVGEFIELSRNDVIPADILLLHSSDQHSICYIETANIDGETSLKQRHVALGYVQDGGRREDHFCPTDFAGELYCEQPHEKISEFNGYIVQSGGERVPVSKLNLLLRGCVVRNTHRVAGMVVYAGHETKALLNNSGPRAKRSKLEQDINTEIVSQGLILLALCITGAVVGGIWTGRNTDKNIPYFPFSSAELPAELEGFIRFWTYIIILQVIIPISLYTSMEIVKFASVYFVNWDRDMYYASADRPFQCRALNITEDLGQIQYVFSDKTGTLTENEMVFRCCSIGGRNYTHGMEVEFAQQSLSPTSKTSGQKFTVGTEQTDFPDPPKLPITIDEALHSDRRQSEGYIRDFFVTMAICNSVVVSESSDGEGEGEGEGGGQGEGEGCGQGEGERDLASIIYEAESPDEAALVEAARAYGYALVARSPDKCTITTPTGDLLTFEVLHVLEFDPNRKCMSVIVREPDSARVVLYTKGADSVIFSNLAHHSGLPAEVYHASHEQGSETIGEMTQLHMNQYARLGLRTLCFAKRVLSDEDYGSWLRGRGAAETALEGREQLLFSSACTIEKNLELLGATGIEDRLQDGVPETIASLRVAGIKVWVLTGDKQETAVNIGFSSGLFDAEMDVMVINATSLEECRELLEARSREMCLHEPDSREHSEGSIDSVFSRSMLMRPVTAFNVRWKEAHRESACPTMIPKALVLDGTTMEFALHPSLKRLFLSIAHCCKSVICCRAAPQQKAAVVNLVKTELRQMTLAVGDGANDVSMIQVANIGVGVAGREGMQAVMASDFAMGRFRFLEKLLLVHGHWSYSRLARMILYFFYKNVTYAVLLFWYQLFNGFSGSNPIDSINLQIFNLVYTSIPILVVAIADQDLSKETLLRDKHHYLEGIKSTVYTRIRFWLTMLDAIYQSAVIFFVAYGAYYNTDVGITEFGFVINITVVVVVSLFLALEILHWTIFHHIAVWGSIVFTFVFNYVYTAIDSRQRFQDTYQLMQMTSARPQFWFVLLLAPVIALAPRVIAKVIEHEFFPSLVIKARLQEHVSKTTSRHGSTERGLPRNPVCVPEENHIDSGVVPSNNHTIPS